MQSSRVVQLGLAIVFLACASLLGATAGNAGGGGETSLETIEERPRGFLLRPGRHSAEDEPLAGMRLVAMVDDSDPTSLSRTHEFNNRVVGELQRSLRRRGIVVIDEEMIATRLGFAILDRREKPELIQTIKTANQSADTNVHSRLFTVFRTVMSKQDLSYAQVLLIRVAGEVYDSRTNEKLASYEVPIDGLKRVPLPAECNQRCLIEAAGNSARDLGASLGDVLARQVEAIALSDGRRATTQPGAKRGLRNRFTLVFRRFEDFQVAYISKALRDEFSGSGQLAMADKKQGLQRYSYVTSLSSTDLREQLERYLYRGGLEAGRDVTINFANQTFNVELLSN